jgi:hypothetical protein
MLAMAYDSNNPGATMNNPALASLAGIGTKGVGKGSAATTAPAAATPAASAAPAAAAAPAGGKKVNPKDWEEFFDESARAKYWYNKKTGEASWISPFKMG